MKRFKEISEQHREKGKFKPVKPYNVADVSPRLSSDSANVNLKEEGWSQKYKNSIDCNNPKGFSQKAHCAGKKKTVSEDLRNWFNPNHPKGGWKRVNSKGEVVGDCAREPGEPKPKCMSNAQRASLSKKEKAAAVRRKRREDPNPERKGEPINVKSKVNEDMEILNEKNKPTNPGLWAKAIAQAKSKFDVYPSAYANGWASKWYKEHGGGWKSVSEANEVADDPINQGTPEGIAKRGNKTVIKSFKQMSEEVEQIDELRTSTLLRYATKANKSLIGGDRNKEEKRIKGIQTANYKIQNRYKVKEEVEQIEEGRPSQRHPLEGHEYHKKSDEALIHIAKDAHAAAEAMKGHNTTAENKYRDQANDSATVRHFRKTSGMPDWYKKKYGHVNEAKDEQEYGYEGDMAMNQLQTIIRHSEYLMEMMEPDTDLPEWVQSKITLAADYIQTACDYMTSEMNEEVEQIDEAVEKNTKPPFDGPYKKTPTVVTDKSGAKHGPMSRARDLARNAAKKQAGKMHEEKEKSRKVQIIKNASKGKDKFEKDPIITDTTVKTDNLQ